MNLPTPLQGIKVLDLARVLAGPLCSAMLADLGADVTKIEMPGSGDDSRTFAPHLGGESTYFMLLNRGKKSLTLNLKKPEGREILLRLIEQADVLVENFRPGVTARLGIDYDTVRAINPKLVYASISGFGQEGPLAQRPAYDHIVQAMGGIMTVTGWPDSPPTRVGDAIGDVVAGMYGAWGVLAALMHRSVTGSGQHIDVALLDAVMSLQLVSLAQVVGGGPAPSRIGNGHPISAPMDSYRTSDGYVVIAVANDRLFVALADAMGRPDLADDERFCTDALRQANSDDLRLEMESWTTNLTVESVVGLLETAGVPVAPIWNIEEALDSDYAKHRELVRETEHPTAGTVRVLTQPVRFSAIPATTRLNAPLLGQHSDEILEHELGMSAADVDDLRRRNVV